MKTRSLSHVYNKKELSSFKPGALKLQVLSPFTKVELDPFLDQLPIKIGLKLRLLGFSNNELHYRSRIHVRRS